MPSLTLGRGANQPQGKTVSLQPPFPEAVFATLLNQAPDVESWFSLHVWKDDYRKKEHWKESIGVAVDVDYTQPEMPPPGLPDRLLDSARSGLIPGCIFHLTPHGARVIFAYETACAHRDLQIAASKGAGVLVDRALADLGLSEEYKVDPCTWDLGRLFYTHNSIAKGVRRVAELIQMRVEHYSPDDLAEHAPLQPAPDKPRNRTTVTTIDESIQSRINRWVADHSPAYPSHPKDCPICGHRGCFKQLPDDPLRWFCFSTNHTGVGIESEGGHHGDAMDIECHTTGKTRIEILRRDGYLPAPRTTTTNTSAPEPTPIRAEPETSSFRAWRNRSYLTCVDILRKNARDVLEGRKLELNELTGRAELGRQMVTEVDITRIRSRIEALFSGGYDKEGNERGMQQGLDDLFRAADEVATEHRFNPLREYLSTLHWDGVARIESVAEDVLGLQREELTNALLKRFFISAVARAMQPGCKVDTVLVLVGPQGAGKSSFFRILGGQWFSDSAVDIKDKDSFQALRGLWIYEWAELEALNRARDSSAAKAFLTSSVDHYRPSYGRLVVDVPRSCVIVGSTNKREFLEDETGNRRFWPLEVNAIDTKLLTDQRDQLWAEAVQLYRNGVHWWLDEPETNALMMRQKGFFSADAWGDAVLSLDYENNEFSTADVFRNALKKEIHTWTRADEMRVAKILRSNGLEKVKPHRGAQVWKRR